tara:strand:+ start:6940 stop:8445 length:1506 start_codon:yes stop_codon:yes gene_type:complete
MSAKIEKNIITGMILSGRFLEEIKPIYRPLTVPFARTVADWCIEYYEEYKKPPLHHIQDIFIANRDKMSEEEEDLTASFLSHISDEIEESPTFNVEYTLNASEKYFRTIALKEVSKKLSTSITKGNIDKAENIVKEFERVARPQTKGINPFDEDVIRKAFADDSGDALFQFPGVLGGIVGHFEREHLVSFVGVSSIGKSWWLMWMALLGLSEGFRVVYASLEMSEKQMVKRIHQYLNACPTKELDELLLPLFDCVKNQRNTCERKERECDVGVFDDNDELLKPSTARRRGYKTCTNCKQEYKQAIWHKKVKREVLSEEMVLAKNRILYGGLLRKNRFRFIKYPSKGATVVDLKTHLLNMENYEGFVPDIIVTDMADKFSADNTRQDTRHQIDEVWMAHKAMAQERRCLVVTASQSNTMRTQKDIKQGDWAESVGKINESDICFALNQQPEEKPKGLMRIGVLKQRDDDFDLNAEVNVLMSYKIGRPYLDSKLKERREKKEK